ncbi:MAG: type I glyceraldehyde-3-phosphate dehydrogenase, partial [Cyclobacteriaceae bacterium]
MTKVGINGLGRIGRAAFKILIDHPDMEVVAINDLIPTDNLAYLLRYDTVYGRFHRKVESKEQELIVDGKSYPVYNEKDPTQIPWKEKEVDVVLECTGVFTKKEDLDKHLQAGASQVILSAPAKDEDIPTIVHGVNHEQDLPDIISTASCTTNCIAPVVEIVKRRIGMKKANMTTTHAYTSSQGIVDSPAKKMRRGRAAAANFVPTSTGAAKATGKAIPEVEGIFDGAAIRGPIPAGSIADINIVTEKKTSVDELKKIFKEEANGRYDGIIGLSEDELVSSDILQDDRASIIDGGMLQVVDGDLVKIMSWYDNEWGYASQM